MTSLRRPHHHSETEQMVFEGITLGLFALLFIGLALKLAGVL